MILRGKNIGDPLAFRVQSLKGGRVALPSAHSSLPSNLHCVPNLRDDVFSAHHLRVIQLENANLVALREASLDSSAPPYFNELLNHACTVSEFLLPPERRQSLVLVFYPSLQVRHLCFTVQIRATALRV